MPSDSVVVDKDDLVARRQPLILARNLGLDAEQLEQLFALGSRHVPVLKRGPAKAIGEQHGQVLIGRLGT